jgi:MFS family permease
VNQVEAPGSGDGGQRPAPFWLPWSVWGIAAAFYLIGFFQRVSPAVMTGELMRDFRIGAQKLGSLSAFYFYFYVAMQIPIGILIDRWGAKAILVAGSISVSLGTFLFGSTEDFGVACLGRAIIGGASAVGWLVLLKLATHWFPPRRFAMLSGLGLFFGNLGALTAQVPLRLLIELYGWRVVVLASAMLAFAIGLLSLVLVENDPAAKGFFSFAPAGIRTQSLVSFRELFGGIRKVFEYSNTWLIFLAQGGLVGPILAFTGLWGVPYLERRYGLTAKSAAAICSIMIICWALASPICGSLSDRMGRRKPIYLAGACLSTIGWFLMFYVPGLSITLFTAISAVTALACGSGVLGFAFSKESVPARCVGTISGITNIGNMLGPTLLQPVIGILLDRHWSGKLVAGSRIYDVSAFEQAFLPMLSWSALSCFLITLTRETYCEHRM